MHTYKQTYIHTYRQKGRHSYTNKYEVVGGLTPSTPAKTTITRAKTKTHDLVALAADAQHHALY